MRYIMQMGIRKRRLFYLKLQQTYTAQTKSILRQSPVFERHKNKKQLESEGLRANMSTGTRWLTMTKEHAVNQTINTSISGIEAGIEAGLTPVSLHAGSSMLVAS